MFIKQVRGSYMFMKQSKDSYMFMNHIRGLEAYWKKTPTDY